MYIDNGTVTCNFSEDTLDMIGILSDLTTADITDNSAIWNYSLCSDVCNWNDAYFVCSANDTLLEINLQHSFLSEPIIPPTYNWPQSVTSIGLDWYQFSGYFNFSTLPRALEYIDISDNDLTGR